MNFNKLITQIEQTHHQLQQHAINVVNISLTLRNWLVGLYIVEFEQAGEDRATYGERLLEKIAERLQHIEGFSHRNLKTFRAFYRTYPHISKIFHKHQSIDSYQLKSLVMSVLDSIPQIGQPLTAQFTNTPTIDGNNRAIGQPLTAQLQIVDNKILIPPEKLITHLTFTHLVEIIRIDDPLQRTFYEVECIKGNWSVRTLRRQIGTSLFERTGGSKNKEKLIQLANQGAEIQTIGNTTL